MIFFFLSNENVLKPTVVDLIYVSEYTKNH